MSNSRLIYFSDEAFNRLESMTLYDKKGKLMSRAKKINYLILDKFGKMETEPMVTKQKVRDLEKRLINWSKTLAANTTFKYNLNQDLYPQLFEDFQRLEQSIKVMFFEVLK